MITYYLIQGDSATSIRLDMLTVLSACLADCPVAVSLFLNSSQNFTARVTTQTSEAAEIEEERLLSDMLYFILAVCLAFGNDQDGGYAKITKVKCVTSSSNF